MAPGQAPGGPLPGGFAAAGDDMKPLVDDQMGGRALAGFGEIV